jgi:hypothetical protein
MLNKKLCVFIYACVSYNPNGSNRYVLIIMFNQPYGHKGIFFTVFV